MYKEHTEIQNRKSDKFFWLFGKWNLKHHDMPPKSTRMVKTNNNNDKNIKFWRIVNNSYFPGGSVNWYNSFENPFCNLH